MKRTRRIKSIQKVKDTKEEDNTVYTREQLEKLLKPKMMLFAREYCLNAWNGTQAYKDTYQSKAHRLSDNTCRVNASKLLTKTNIKQYIAFLKADTEELTGVSRDRNLRELAKMAYSSISHLHDSWVSLKEYEDLTEDQKAAIKDTKCKTYYTQSGTEVTEVHIVLHAKQPAIETINKMMGYNATENIKINQTTTTQIDLTKYTDEEKALMLKMARKNEYQ